MPRTVVRSVLAATDLSPSSDRVVGTAAALAAQLEAQLHLLHVLDRSVEGEREPHVLPERVRQAEEAVAEQLRRTASGIRPASLETAGGEVHEVILARAAAVSAGVIVLGPHRGGDVGARVLGTTADRVIREAEVPSLVVSAPLSLPVRRIGVPTDFSEPARGALDVAFALAAPLGDGSSELRVFHVGWTVERADNPAMEERELIPKLRREVEEAAVRSGVSPSPPVRTEVVWGVDPAESIATHAQKAGMDLLVLGTAGQGGLKRVLIGSVASGVARHASCPVLLVPPALARRAPAEAGGE